MLKCISAALATTCITCVCSAHAENLPPIFAASKGSILPLGLRNHDGIFGDLKTYEEGSSSQLGVILAEASPRFLEEGHEGQRVRKR